MNILLRIVLVGIVIMPTFCKAANLNNPVVVDITTPEGRKTLAALPAGQAILYRGSTFNAMGSADRSYSCLNGSQNSVVMIDGEEYLSTGKIREYIQCTDLQNNQKAVSHQAVHNALIKPGTFYDKVRHNVKIWHHWIDQVTKDTVEPVRYYTEPIQGEVSSVLNTLGKCCIAATIAGAALAYKYREPIKKAVARLVQSAQKVNVL